MRNSRPFIAAILPEDREGGPDELPSCRHGADQDDCEACDFERYQEMLGDR